MRKLISFVSIVFTIVLGLVSALAAEGESTVAPVIPEVKLHSPFKSTVSGNMNISIPNAHVLEQSATAGIVLRGEQPGDHILELAAAGITDVLIFKKQTQAEVDQELAILTGQVALDGGSKKMSFPAERVHIVPFPWKNFPDQQVACQQSLQALRVLRDIHNQPGRSVYFHCTVGEDRTGYLAGLYRILFDGWTAQQAWINEMCKWGYGSGDPRKPDTVNQAINRELTPIFLRMLELLESQKLSLLSLDDDQVCDGFGSLPLPADAVTWVCPVQTDNLSAPAVGPN